MLRSYPELERQAQLEHISAPALGVFSSERVILLPQAAPTFRVEITEPRGPLVATVHHRVRGGSLLKVTQQIKGRPGAGSLQLASPAQPSVFRSLNKPDLAGRRGGGSPR